MPYSCDRRASSFEEADRGAHQALDRVIVFDLDDTLYLERDFVHSGFRAVGRWARGQLAIDDLEAAMVESFAARMHGRVFDEALRRCGRSADPATIARMLQVYRQHDPDIALAADAARVLARRPGHIGVGIITDGFLDAQKRKLRALNVLRRGARIAICTDRWGRRHWKPSSRAFEYLERFFRVSGDAMTYVADNPNKDFHAPRRLGWHTVRIDRPDRIVAEPGPDIGQADRTIVTLDDLKM